MNFKGGGQRWQRWQGGGGGRKRSKKISFGQSGVVCSLWRSLLQISFMVLLHGICEFLSFGFMRS